MTEKLRYHLMRSFEKKDTMSTQQVKKECSPREHVRLLLFATSFGLYLPNVLAGKGMATFGWRLLHLSNVAQFLLLLVTSSAIIVVAIHQQVVFG